MNQDTYLAGLKIGHMTDSQYHSGCTVFLCPEGSVAGVDVRGPAPGSRETALLAADKRVINVNAIVMTGGSALGLASADGVAQYLADHEIGHFTPIRRIPIVPAAVVYDLFLSQGAFLPDREAGYRACQEARSDNWAQGNVGAGAGVTVGKWAGFEHMMKGGFGLASMQRDDLVVGAAAVVNAVGDVVAEDGSVLAGARGDDGGWLVAENGLRYVEPPAEFADFNTCLILVATNARLSKPEANRLAQVAHDGLAIAIRPAHTSHDGDTAFAVSAGDVVAPFDLVCRAAVAMVAEAIRNGVRYAQTVGQVMGLADDGSS